MAARRKRRFGTIRELPSGRWQARYRGPDGLMRSAPHTFSRQREADQWLTVIESELLRGEWIDPWLSEVTLGRVRPQMDQGQDAQAADARRLRRHVPQPHRAASRRPRRRGDRHRDRPAVADNSARRRYVSEPGREGLSAHSRDSLYRRRRRHDQAEPVSDQGRRQGDRARSPGRDQSPRSSTSRTPCHADSARWSCSAPSRACGGASW